MAEALAFERVEPESSPNLAPVVELYPNVSQEIFDANNFEHVYNATQKVIGQAVLKLANGNQADGADIFATTYAKAYEHFDQFTGSLNDRLRWLHTIAKNAARDQYRRNNRKLTVPLEANEYSVSDAQSTAAFDQIDEKLSLPSYLDHLTTKHREVIIKAYWEGKKIKEIASELGIPSDTVKTRLSRAKKYLRQELIG
jgi:RNA polymerase sigma-70 factor (ECF subfamily)